MANFQMDASPKPPWLRSRVSDPSVLHEIKISLRSKSLHTVCESARCPNICECFGKKTATFMIMGDICTRNCGFCAVEHGTPRPLDPAEPLRIAEMVKELGLKHVVITSVTRDDLIDGGAAHFAATIRTIRCHSRESGNPVTIEVLTPDFSGDQNSLKTILDARPDVFNHNLETVERLTHEVRPDADYRRSLEVLEFARNYSKDIVIKSGLMVGLGEGENEICQTLDELAGAGCDIVTIGQYLRPGKEHLAVKKYVEPEAFARYKEYGESAGIKHVFAGPMVRSSYMAKDVYEAMSFPRKRESSAIRNSGSPLSRG